MICMRRRSRRRPLRERVVISLPSNRTLPPSDSTSRRIAWAVEVLPQPDSPTSATISPLATESDDSGHRVHVPLWAAEERPAQPSRNAVADDQVLDLEQRTAVAAVVGHVTTARVSAKWHALT